MQENPFEAPEVMEPPPSEAYGAEHVGEFDIGTCLSEAWNATWANFGLWLLATLVFVALMVVSMMTVIGGFIVVPVLTWGVVRLYINMHDGRAEFQDMFSGFQDFGRSWISIAGIMFFMVMISIVGQSLQYANLAVESLALQAAGAILSLVFSFIVMPRFYFAPLFVVDQGLGPLTAMQRSWQVTQHQKARVVGLIVVGMILIFVSILALIVGAIPGTTMFYLSWVSAYRQTVGQHEPHDHHEHAQRMEELPAG